MPVAARSGNQPSTTPLPAKNCPPPNTERTFVAPTLDPGSQGQALASKPGGHRVRTQEKCQALDHTQAIEKEFREFTGRRKEERWEGEEGQGGGAGRDFSSFCLWTRRNNC